MYIRGMQVKPRDFLELERKNEELRNQLGRMADSADNYLATLEIPMPDRMKLDSLKTGMEELSEGLKALYVELSGENPWQE